MIAAFFYTGHANGTRKDIAVDINRGEHHL